MRNMCLWGYYPIQDDPQNFNMYCLANSGSTELGNHNTGIPVLSTIIHNTGIKIGIIWSSQPRYWYYNTGNTSILPVSSILVQILVNTSIPVSSSICNTRRYWSLPKYEYCRYQKILGNTGNTSIADTGRFWKILVIPVLQILENTGYTSIADIGR